MRLRQLWRIVVALRNNLYLNPTIVICREQRGLPTSMVMTVVLWTKDRPRNVRD